MMGIPANCSPRGAQGVQRTLQEHNSCGSGEVLEWFRRGSRVTAARFGLNLQLMVSATPSHPPQGAFPGLKARDALLAFGFRRSWVLATRPGGALRLAFALRLGCFG